MKHKIEIDGKAYGIKYSVNALCALEERSGSTFEQHLSQVQKKMSLASIRWLFAVGHQVYDPMLSTNACGDILEDYFLSGGTLENLVDEISKAAEDSGFFIAAVANTAQTSATTHQTA